MAKSGSSAWSHSEPGSGPTPVYTDDNDKAIKGGWRRDPPPIAYPEVWPPPDPEPVPEE